MNSKFSTELIYHQLAIHSKFHGDINREDIICAIQDWKQLLLDNISIQFLVFDYADAKMTTITTMDVQTIANMTTEITDIKKDIVLIGVFCDDLEFGLARMWEAYAELNDNQAHILRNIDDVQQVFSDYEENKNN